jgi:hypothetical protein
MNLKERLNHVNAIIFDYGIIPAVIRKWSC